MGLSSPRIRDKNVVISLLSPGAASGAPVPHSGTYKVPTRIHNYSFLEHGVVIIAMVEKSLASRPHGPCCTK